MRQNRIWQKHGGRMGLAIDGTKQLLEDEARTLEQPYSARVSGGLAFLEEQRRTDPSVEPIIQRCRQFADLGIVQLPFTKSKNSNWPLRLNRSVRLRGLSHTNLQCMPSMRAFDILYIRGPLNANSGSFLPAFKSLTDTTAARHLRLDGFPHNDLVVTKDFIRTVTVPTGKRGLYPTFTSVLSNGYCQVLIAATLSDTWLSTADMK